MTRHVKKIFWTWFWRIMVLVIVILLASIAGNQQSIMIMQTDAMNKLNEIDVTLNPEDTAAAPADPTALHSLGEFTITHYANDVRCCGKADGITATGTQATVGRTIAVDPDVIPLGSEVVIDGHTYTAEDVGGAINGKKIDIFVGSYQEAVNRGKISREVFTEGDSR